MPPSGLFKPAVTTHVNAGADPDPDARSQRRHPRRRPPPRRSRPSRTRPRASTSATGRARSTGRKVAAAGKRFAYMKASEETTYGIRPTSRIERRRGLRGCTSAHTTSRNRGARAGSAIAQADHFLDTAGPLSGELLPVLDLERTNGLTPAALTAWVQAFMQRVYDRTGLRAVIYCSPNFWKVYMANTSWFAENGYQVLWVAHWTTASVADHAGGQLGRQRAGRSGSTRPMGPCPGSSAGSISTATTALTSRRSSSPDRRATPWRDWSRCASQTRRAISSQSSGTSSQTPSHPRWPTYGGRKKRAGSVSMKSSWTRSRRRGPEGDPVVVVMIRVHDERLPADEPRRFAMAESLGHIGQGRAQGAKPRQRIVVHGGPRLTPDAQENARRNRRSLAVPNPM